MKQIILSLGLICSLTTGSLAKVMSETKEQIWSCPGCTSAEKYVLKQLQKKTKIRDRNALATILGNIKSESNFHPDICELSLIHI